MVEIFEKNYFILLFKFRDFSIFIYLGISAFIRTFSYLSSLRFENCLLIFRYRIKLFNFASSVINIKELLGNRISRFRIISVEMNITDIGYV